jgi:leucyl/phenylalanyl-tRNA--protein transferase
VPVPPRPEDLLAGYAAGWFPMDIDGQLGFYESDPRVVIPLEGFRVPRSVRRALRTAGFETRIDAAFSEVVAACGGPRQGGAWLTPRLGALYVALHEQGHAHSVEIWRESRLVGGLFGVALGGLFTSESMFHRESDAGNAALVATHRHISGRGYTLWDIQMSSPHTARFGATLISGREYRHRLASALAAGRTFVRGSQPPRRSLGALRA